MRTWFRTPHPNDTDVDISSVSFWSKSFDERDVAFSQLRATRPVSWHPALETPGLPRKNREAGFWAVAKAKEIVYASRRHDLFSSEIGQVSVRPTPFRPSANILVLDPPLHNSLRRIVNDAFTPAAVAQLEDRIERDARRIVLRAAAQKTFDFVSEVSARLPLKTIARLIGVPDSEQDAFIIAADAHVRDGIPARLPAGMSHESYFAQQAASLSGICSELVRWRRSQPGDDLISRLVCAQINGSPLSDEAILSAIILLIVAGADTTKQATTHSLLALDRFPDQRAWLVEDFEARFDVAFEELVRFASPVISFARTATQDLELAEAHIEAGDKVALFYCSGNRDEDLFPAPDHLDLDRRPNPHVGFGGGGVHFCLGSRIARLQVKALLSETFALMPNLVIGTPTYGFGESVHSVTELPVSCGDPVAGRGQTTTAKTTTTRSSRT